MLFRRRILVVVDDGAIAPAPSPGRTFANPLTETTASATAEQAAKRSATTEIEAVSAQDVAQISPLFLQISSPVDSGLTNFPFTATGIATRGAIIRVYSIISGDLIGSTVADAVTGNWSVQINSM